MKTIDPSPLDESEEPGETTRAPTSSIDDASNPLDAAPASHADGAVDDQVVVPSATIDPPTPGRTPRRWWKRVFRFLIAIIAVGAVAAGVVFAWPIVNDRVLQPVETNSQDTAAIQSELGAALDSIDALEAEVGQLRTNISALDADRTDDLATIADEIDAVDVRIDEVDTRLESLAESQETSAAAGLALSDRLSELKAMELLSRARLFLYQANYGLAAEDVGSARAILADIDGDEPSRTLAIERLDVVLGALPDRPVAASGDLDIAWRALLGEVPAIALSPPAAPATTTTTALGSTTTPGAVTTQP